jgi:hypothetical protein
MTHTADFANKARIAKENGNIGKIPPDPICKSSPSLTLNPRQPLTIYSRAQHKHQGRLALLPARSYTDPMTTVASS